MPAISDMKSAWKLVGLLVLACVMAAGLLAMFFASRR